MTKNFNIINLNPQRIKEYKSCKLEERLINFYLTLSKSEFKLVKDFVDIEPKKNIMKCTRFIEALSEREFQLIVKLIHIMARIKDENAEPCKIIHMQAK